MSIIIGGKAVDLQRLEAEIVAGGVQLRGLGYDGAALHTYDADGAILPFSASDAATVQSTMAAHVSPVAVDYGTAAADIVDVEQVRAWVQASRTFLALATPTQAQSQAQIQRNTRALLALVKMLGANE